jgi:hypothetical protein
MSHSFRNKFEEQVCLLSCHVLQYTLGSLKEICFASMQMVFHSSMALSTTEEEIVLI